MNQKQDHKKTESESSLDFFPFGPELNAIQYKVGKDKCLLLIPDYTKDIDFAKKMQSAEGPTLSNWLYVAREAAWANQIEAERDVTGKTKEFNILCKETDCEKCEKFKDYYKRLNNKK